ncbi:hypothetical protein MW887_004355 [Aspergillus wentii]|nr:hypothetical protein MW887_004355 [Aspergillus wentii]
MYSILLLFLLPVTLASSYCPLLGPVFPIPKSLCNNAAITTAKHNISSILDATTKGTLPLNSILDLNSTSFSLQIFSTGDSAPLFEYSYTSPDIRNATVGVREVDGDTIFRIGSGSKLWTVLLLLIEKGDAVFAEPVAKYVPEIRDAVKELSRNTTEKRDGIDFPRWEEITIGELASHMSGIGRDYGFGDYSFLLDDPTAYGLPQLSDTDTPPCGRDTACSRANFFNGFLKRHPVVPSASTPVYSNAAFQILAYALETMTSQTYEGLLVKDILRPLGLNHSSYSKPDDKLGVIPGDVNSSYWALDSGDETPAGGLYSSVKDMSALGRAILTNKLLSPALTRRWMKPVTHTSSLAYSVGAPWEIYSFPSSRVIDLYTKAGDLGGYSSVLALSPDHSVGFTILAAGTQETTSTTDVVSYLSDMISTTLIPALEDAAKIEAAARFTGVYASTKTNSSLTLTADDGPGLKVQSWISNSDNLLGSLAQLKGYGNLDIRLYPTGLESTNHVSFRAIIRDLSASRGIGPTTNSCITWGTVDGMLYGSVGLDEFMFELNQSGDVVGVSPGALRISLARLV